MASLHVVYLYISPRAKNNLPCVSHSRISKPLCIVSEMPHTPIRIFCILILYQRKSPVSIIQNQLSKTCMMHMTLITDSPASKAFSKCSTIYIQGWFGIEIQKVYRCIPLMAPRFICYDCAMSVTHRDKAFEFFSFETERNQRSNKCPDERSKLELIS